MFTERPIIVAAREAGKALTASIAEAILRLDMDSPDFASVSELQGSAVVDEKGSEPWAKGVAAVNCHGAGGNALDPNFQRRGVLGLLSSMMQHECSPSCVVHISSADSGSLVSLHTIREVLPGELLSISYIGGYQTSSRRRKLLQSQHSFTCTCPRCTVLPEMVRAFRCPACGEGPCSPASPEVSCREIICDECECTLVLDDEAWADFEAAENCDVVCAECMSVLHPFHHRPVLMYQHNLLKLPPGARAEVLLQHKEARERVYSTFAAADVGYSLVANDVEAAAIALLAAGEPERAAECFKDAAARFAAFYGASSVDAGRCQRGAQATTLSQLSAEFGKQGYEVHAHH